MKRKKTGILMAGATITFVITVSSISLAADSSAKPEKTADKEQYTEAYIEALASGNAVYDIPALASNSITTTVKQAKTAYEEKLAKQKKAAEEAEKARLAEEARITEEKRLAEAAAIESVQNPAVEVSASEQELLAALIFCEAGNQPYEGQVAVGAVVMNRVRSGVYPNSISEVIYQSGQFTPAMTGWLDSVLSSGGYTDSAMQAAADALTGSNPVGDMLYFDCGGYGYQIGDHYFH